MTLCLDLEVYYLVSFILESLHVPLEPSLQHDPFVEQSFPEQSFLEDLVIFLVMFFVVLPSFVTVVVVLVVVVVPFLSLS